MSTGHFPDIDAVIDDVTTLGIRTGRRVDRSTEGSTRAVSVALDIRVVGRRWRWAESGSLSWDERTGWSIAITEDTSHGYVYPRYELGLAPDADPAEVALRVAMLFEAEGPEPV